MKKLVPKRRFEEFKDSEAWEQRKLGDIVHIKDSARIPNALWRKDGVPYLRSSNLDNDTNEMLYIDRKDYEMYKSKTGAPELGDVLFNSGGNIGTAILKNDAKPVYVQGGAVLYIKTSTSEKLEGMFLKFYFETPAQKKYILHASVGGTIKHFTLVPANAMPIAYPPKDEQKQIGFFFCNLNNLLTLHQRKLKKLKSLKSAYLSEMFPKDGELYPKRRFAGFTDPWEQRKVASIAERFDNLRIPVTASNRIPGNTPYYGANGILDYVDGFTHDGEFVLIAEDGANDLNDYPVHYVNGKVWVNNHAHVIKAKEQISDNKFLMYSFKTIDIATYLVGGSRAKLNADTMMDLLIYVPKIEEQIKIGDFFKHLDNLITLHQRKLEKLEALKQAYLSEMFV